MKNFLEEKTKLEVYEIKSVVLKDYDDENGYIGEHYIVDFVVKRWCNDELPIYNFWGEQINWATPYYSDKKCLVNVSEYKRFQKLSVIFID